MNECVDFVRGRLSAVQHPHRQFFLVQERHAKFKRRRRRRRRRRFRTAIRNCGGVFQLLTLSSSLSLLLLMLIPPPLRRFLLSLCIRHWQAARVFVWRERFASCTTETQQVEDSKQRRRVSRVTILGGMIIHYVCHMLDSRVVCLLPESHFMSNMLPGSHLQNTQYIGFRV